MAADCLHLSDGPEVAERDAMLGRVPDDIAWIHGYDVEEAAGRPV
jgi:hypothetical protein